MRKGIREELICVIEKSELFDNAWRYYKFRNFKGNKEVGRLVDDILLLFEQEEKRNG